MQNLLLDHLPFDPEVTERGGNSLLLIIGGILVALVALGFLIFMIRRYRRKDKQ